MLLFQPSHIWTLKCYNFVNILPTSFDSDRILEFSSLVTLLELLSIDTSFDIKGLLLCEHDSIIYYVFVKLGMHSNRIIIKRFELYLPIQDFVSMSSCIVTSFVRNLSISKVGYVTAPPTDTAARSDDNTIVIWKWKSVIFRFDVISRNVLRYDRE